MTGPSLFLSHSHEDLEAVEKLERLLLDSGLSVWRDQRDLRPGQRLPKVLGEAIAESRALLLVWSCNAARSDYVEQEWCTAVALKKTILPYCLDGTDLPFFLRSVLTTNARDPDAVSRFLTSLQSTQPPEDTTHTTEVLSALRELPARDPARAADDARSLFVERGWVPQAWVFRAGRDIHVTSGSSDADPQQPGPTSPGVAHLTAHRDINVFYGGTSAVSPDYAARINNFLSEYLGTPGSPVPFGGRERDIEFLNSWLNGPHQPNRLMIAAPAGRGKSALLVHWRSQIAPHAASTEAVFFPVSIRFRTNLASVVFMTLCARLAELHGENVPATPDTPVDVWRAMVSEYLARPLPGGRQLLLILDGIDEAADWEIGPDLFPYHLPPTTRIVLSGRYLVQDSDTTSWLRRLGWDQPGQAAALDLEPLTAQGVADVLRDMSFPAHKLADRVDIVAELHRLSEGDPLLVRLYVQDLWERGDEAVRLRPGDLREIRPGLDGFFERWWEDQRRLWGDKTPLRQPVVQTLLNILSCALGPLQHSDVTHLAPPDANLTLWTLDEALKPLGRFIIGDGAAQGYAFSHPRLAYYFYEKLRAAGEAQGQDSRFVDWGKETLRALNEKRIELDRVPLYLIQYYRSHLERSDCEVDVLGGLVSEGWLKAWSTLDRGSYVGFLADVGAVWSRAETANWAALAEGTAARHLSVDIRCALCQSSISSIAASLPLGLLLGLVDKGVWSPAQALVYSARIPDLNLRIEALTSLGRTVPATKRPIVASALATAVLEISNEADRISRIRSLSLSLPQDLLIALTRPTVQIRDPEARAQLLLSIVWQGLPAPERSEALSQALEASLEIEGAPDRVSMLCQLAGEGGDPVREKARAEALSATLSIEDVALKARMLVTVIQSLPPSLRTRAVGASLRVALDLRGASPAPRLLKTVSPHLSEDELLEAVATVRSFPAVGREEAWMALASGVEGRRLPHLITEARGIVDESLRFRVVWQATLRLPPPARGEALLELLPTVMQLARTAELDPNRSEALLDLVWSLPARFIPDLAEFARGLIAPALRCRMLQELAWRSDSARERLAREALDAALDILDGPDRRNTLQALALDLPPPVQQASLQAALRAILGIEDPAARLGRFQTLLESMPPRFGGMALQEARAAMENIPEPAQRVLLHQVLVSRLAGPERTEAIRDMLGELTLVDDTEPWLSVLRAASAHVTPDVLSNAVEYARRLSTRHPVKAWTTLARLVPGSLLDRVAAATEGTDDPEARFLVRWLAISRAPEPEREAAFFRAVPAALEAADRLWAESRRSEVFADLVWFAPEARLAELRAAARGLRDPADRCRFLRELVWRSADDPGSIVLEAVECARAIPDLARRPRFLGDLARDLPDVGGRAILELVVAASHEIGDPAARIDFLDTFAQRVGGGAWKRPLDDALDAALTIESPTLRIAALVKLHGVVGGRLRGKARDAARSSIRTIRDPVERAAALTMLLPVQPDRWKKRAVSEARTATEAIPVKAARIDALWSLTPHLPQSDLPEELIDHCVSEIERWGGGATTALLQSAQEKHALHAVVAAVPGLADVSARIGTLISVAKLGTQPYRHDALTAVLRELRQMAPSQRWPFLDAELLDLFLSPPGPTPELLSGVLTVLPRAEDEAMLETWLKGLAPRIPEALLDSFFALFWTLDMGWNWSFLFPSLQEAPGRHEVLPRALATVRKILDETHRSRALLWLSPQLGDSCLTECLQIARALRDGRLRARTLSGLADRLPDVRRDRILVEAMRATSEVEVDADLADHLTGWVMDSGDVSEEVLTEATRLTLRIPGHDDRARVLGRLSSALPRTLLEEASAPLQYVGDQADCARTLRDLALLRPESPRFDEIMAKALAAARRIATPGERSIGLAEIAAHLTGPEAEEVQRDALDALRGIPTHSERARALASMAPHLSDAQEGVLLSALFIAETVEWEGSGLPSSLLVHLPAPLVPRLITSTYPIASDDGNRAWCRVLVSRSPPDLRRTIRDALLVTEEDRGDFRLASPPPEPSPAPPAALDRALHNGRGADPIHARAEALCELIPRLPETLLADALEHAVSFPNEHLRARILAALALRIPERLLPDAFHVLDTIPDPVQKAMVVRRLACAMPESLLDEALGVVRTIDDRRDRAIALARLAVRRGSPGSTEIFEEALRGISTIEPQERRCAALLEIAQLLPEGLLTGALAAADALRDEAYRAAFLEATGPWLPATLWPQMLSSLSSISKEEIRSTVLIRLSTSVSESTLPGLLEALGDLHHPSFQTDVLVALARQLSTTLAPELLPAATGLPRTINRVEALCALVPRLPEPLASERLHDVLTLIPEVLDEPYRAALLEQVAPVIAADHFPAALTVVRTIEDDFTRAQALRHVLRRTSPADLAGARSALSELEDDYNRAVLLGELACCAADPERTSLIEEALGTARRLGGRFDRAEALREMAARMRPTEPSVISHAIAAAAALGRDGYLADIFIELASVAPELSAEDILNGAFAIGDELERARALTGLIPHLPASLHGSLLAGARDLKSESRRIAVVCEIAPHLSESLLGKALDVAEGLRSSTFVTDLLGEIAGSLTDEQLARALSIATGIDSEFLRQIALGRLLPALPEAVVPDVLDALRRFHNEAYVCTLLGGLTLIPETALEETLAVARGLRDPYRRSRALLRVARHFPPGERHEISMEALRLGGTLEDPSGRADVLRELPRPVHSDLIANAESLLETVPGEAPRARLRQHLSLSLPPPSREELRELLSLTRGSSAAPSAETRRPETLDRLTEEEIRQRVFSARNLEAEIDFVSTLNRFAASLSPVLLAEALDVSLGLPGEANRIAACAILAPHLPEDLLARAWSASVHFESRLHRSRLAEVILQRLRDVDHASVYGFWSRALHTYSTHHRRDLLAVIRGLLPVMARAAGEGFVEEAVAAVEDIASWWT